MGVPMWGEDQSVTVVGYVATGVVICEPSFAPDLDHTASLSLPQLFSSQLQNMSIFPYLPSVETQKCHIFPQKVVLSSPSCALIVARL